MKYQIGDFVKIRPVEVLQHAGYAAPDMLKWAGTIMHIREIDGDWYRMHDDMGEHLGDGWYWRESVIERKVDLSPEPEEFEAFWGVDSDAMEPDPVNHPQHYTMGKVECIEAIESATEGLSGFDAYLTGNIMKYMWRWSHKNGVEDLKKAKWYIEKLIEVQE